MEKQVFLCLAFSILFSNVVSFSENSTKACSSEYHDKKAHLNNSGIHLTLLNPFSPCSPAPLAKIPFSRLLQHDNSHVASREARLLKNALSRTDSVESPSDMPVLISAPVTPGISVEVGNYIVEIGLGTPATSSIMVVDTGSSLSWLQCAPCVISCHEQAGRLFDPKNSTTYRSVSCSGPACSLVKPATSNPSSCSKSNVCVYQASYGDQSFSLGYLSSDTLSFAGSTFPNFIYGCGQENKGLFGKSAGLIGLARDKLSLFYQLAPSLGHSFSYCFPSTYSAGYLSIGPYKPAEYSFTPMITNPLDESLYFLKFSSISVNGKPIEVSSTAYDTPTIIDSGTVITRLPSAVHSALSKAMVAAMAKTPRAPAFETLDTCFKGSVTSLNVPTVSLTFQGGATIKLAASHVLINVDESTSCLAFVPASNMAILGNMQQQSFSVVYDVGASKIGFSAGGC